MIVSGLSWTHLRKSLLCSAQLTWTNFQMKSQLKRANHSEYIMSSCGLRLKTLLASYWPTMLKISLPVYIINYQDKTTVPGWVLTRVDNQNNYKLTTQQSTNWVNFNFQPSFVSQNPLSLAEKWVERRQGGGRGTSFQHYQPSETLCPGHKDRSDPLGGGISVNILLLG